MAPLNIDANGLGTYRLTVDRTLVTSDGTYTGTVSVTSTANPIDIGVVMQRFTVSPSANAGLQYVLLIDVVSDLVANSAVVSAVDGEYTYTFNNVGAGQYWIYAGSDSDNDALICDPGEACGAFRTLDAPEVLSINSDRANLDFISGFPVNLFNSSVSSEAVRNRPIDISNIPVAPSKETSYTMNLCTFSSFAVAATLVVGCAQAQHVDVTTVLANGNCRTERDRRAHHRLRDARHIPGHAPDRHDGIRRGRRNDRCTWLR